MSEQTGEDGKSFWACERNLIKKCDFITWDVPTKEVCPECGKTMFKRSGRGQAKTFCENEACVKFVPLEARTYKKKSTADKPSGKKAGMAKKTAGKKTSVAGKTRKSAAARSAAGKQRK